VSDKKQALVPDAGAGSAVLVGLGIFLSRIAGLIRDRVFAHFFGNSDAADAFKAAFRIPNFLQNLFGEGTLSASFIPVYARLLAEKRDKEAGQLAGAVAALLSLLISVIVLVGVYATPVLISVIAPGFEGGKRDMTIQLVRILFPGAGLLVLSAWCLGILNSHRRFFVSYSAPIIWNVVMIASLILFGPRLEQFPLTVVYAWASVLGSALQFLVQLPQVVRLARPLYFSINTKMLQVRTVLKNFVPVFFGRGVTQISAYIDSSIASLLPTGALSGLGYAQTLYLLPLSLFGMSVSAAELPSMSSAIGDQHEIAEYLQSRLKSGLKRIAFFIIPSAVAFLALGDVIVAAIYQTGRFGHDDVFYVWMILLGYGFGLLAATLSRLYSSAYYALRDTRTPFRYAVVRVVCSAVLGCLLALLVPPQLGIEQRWGVIGLTLAAGLASWIEFYFLRRRLNGRIGATGIATAWSGRVLVAALVSAATGHALKFFVHSWHPILQAAAVLSGFALTYQVLTTWLRVSELDVVTRFTKKISRRRDGNS
jgi:putative peptidoglycan lipid II flippase